MAGIYVYLQDHSRKRINSLIIETHLEDLIPDKGRHLLLFKRGRPLLKMTARGLIPKSSKS